MPRIWDLAYSKKKEGLSRQEEPVRARSGLGHHAVRMWGWLESEDLASQAGMLSVRPTEETCDGLVMGF